MKLLINLQSHVGIILEKVTSDLKEHPKTTINNAYQDGSPLFVKTFHHPYCFLYHPKHLKHQESEQLQIGLFNKHLMNHSKKEADDASINHYSP